MKIKVDIWSDVMCPFCYIGKRKFENALEQFENRNAVELVWHSYQLDPHLKTQPGVNVYDYLAQRKNISREESIQLHTKVVDMAKNVGLEYKFDKAVIANSFNAHRLLQLAKTKGKGNEMEEQLFNAYFCEGKNTDDFDVLYNLGIKTGIDGTTLKEVLLSDAFSKEVRADEEMARSLNVRGVPFFLFDNKYTVSGAQDSAMFLKALQQTWNEASF